MNLRVKRVRELIKRELGTILERNFHFPGSIVTIHDVDLTPDLRQCFIYAGVMGKTHAADGIIRKLNGGRSLIQRELFKRVRLKYSPSLLFRLDETMERGVRILNAIENLPEPLPDEEPALEDDSVVDEGETEGDTDKDSDDDLVVDDEGEEDGDTGGRR